MPTIRPFAAVRATRDKVHLVASRSYVTYTTKELREKLHGNPFTYLHIIHPDLGAKKIHKSKGTDRMRLVRDRYDQFKQDGIFFREEKPCFYIYRQTKNGHPFTGIIATVALQDYLDGHIRIHEHTLSSRESTFTNYLDNTGLNAEPVLLFHEPRQHIKGLIAKHTSLRPEYEFSTTNRVRHELWLIDNIEEHAIIERAFGEMSHLYIADGHHRCASSAALQMKWKENGRIRDPHHPANFFMAYLLDEDTMRIYPFNRLVQNFGALSREEFLEKLHLIFHVQESEEPVSPKEKGVFGMYIKGQWYRLSLRNATEGIDADMLYHQLLKPVLGIGDQKKDARLSYMEGPRGVHALEVQVNKGRSAVAFTLCPVSTSELRAVADQGECMPPKSTWIEPKLRSGLLIHELFTPVQQALLQTRRQIGSSAKLIAVSKKKTADEILDAYHMGQRDFGENYVQELIDKQPQLPADIRWHFIGHLQSNKVKYIAPFVYTIHAVDSISLLAEIEKHAAKNNRVIPCLIQVHIADEESKFGLNPKDVPAFIQDALRLNFTHAPIHGLMGMATFTENQEKIRSEFRCLKDLRDRLRDETGLILQELSMGMTSDRQIAEEEGSTMIRVGSAIFGERF